MQFAYQLLAVLHKYKENFKGHLSIHTINLSTVTVALYSAYIVRCKCNLFTIALSRDSSKNSLSFVLIDFLFRKLQISVVSHLIRAIWVFVFFLIDILRLLAGEILGRLKTFIDSNFPFHLKLCKGVHSLLDLACIAEI